MFSSSDVRPYGFVQLSVPRSPSTTRQAEGSPQADQELKTLIESARADGQSQGYHEGLQRALDEQGAALLHLAQLVEQARTETSEFIRVLEGQVVSLALEIAQKVIEREVRTDPEIVM